VLASTGFVANVLIGVLYTAGAALVIGIVRAAVQTTRKRQTVARDNAALTEFFFDTPENPRTRVPAKKGWTTRVDELLGQLTDGQSRIERAVHDIRSEVKPDGNGGHNMRGELQRLQKDSNAEAKASSNERGRVQGRDDTIDKGES
jgi:hypothetical protein